MTPQSRMAPFSTPAASFAATFSRALARLDAKQEKVITGLFTTAEPELTPVVGDVRRLADPTVVEAVLRNPHLFQQVRDDLGLGLGPLDTIAWNLASLVGEGKSHEGLQQAARQLRDLIRGGRNVLLRHLRPYMPEEVEDGTYHRVSLYCLPGQLEGVLLYWGMGAGTAIHDHADASGLDCVVDGLMAEETYGWPEEDRDPPLRADRQNSSGDVTHFTPRYLHSVQNDGPGPLTTVRFYVPPPDHGRVTVFERNPATSRLVRRMGV